MKTTYFLLTGWLVLGGAGHARLHAQAGVQAAGGWASSARGSVSYSIGQVAYLTARGPGGTASPGVQQPIKVLVLSAASQAAIDLESSLYPNPTTALLTLRVADKLASALTWRLTDLSGRQLRGQPVAGPLTAISLVDFSAGAYLLTVFKDAQAVKVFKVIKH